MKTLFLCLLGLGVVAAFALPTPPVQQQQAKPIYVTNYVYLTVTNWAASNVTNYFAAPIAVLNVGTLTVSNIQTRAILNTNL